MHCEGTGAAGIHQLQFVMNVLEADHGLKQAEVLTSLGKNVGRRVSFLVWAGIAPLNKMLCGLQEVVYVSG